MWVLCDGVSVFTWFLHRNLTYDGLCAYFHARWLKELGCYRLGTAQEVIAYMVKYLCFTISYFDNYNKNK